MMPTCFFLFLFLFFEPEVTTFEKEGGFILKHTLLYCRARPIDHNLEVET